MRFFLPRRMAPSKCPANAFFCELTRKTVFPQNEKSLFSTEKLKLTALSCVFRAGTGPIPMRFFLPRRMAPSKCPANAFFCELTRKTVFPQNEKSLFSTEKLKLTALSCVFRAGTGPIPMRFFLPRRMAPSKCPANAFFCELTRKYRFPSK